ncbi:hypothetical protein MLD38_019868 [Melastoma candidum]|uniref:Uncharacterized protein n=1 Tax=Melastoma candidum TaxID=119954 RepID=A0ACB9QE41_9MYRT|nr:hypothetical protein MLD38_019868 [Melastoma candidum]
MLLSVVDLAPIVSSAFDLGDEATSIHPLELEMQECPGCKNNFGFYTWSKLVPLLACFSSRDIYAATDFPGWSHDNHRRGHLRVRMAASMPSQESRSTRMCYRYPSVIEFMMFLLDDDYLNIEELSSGFINRVVALHKGPAIDRFLLKVNVRLTDVGANAVRLFECWKAQERLRKAIDDWISFAMSKKVLSLDLDFAGCGRDRNFYEWKGFPVDVTNSRLVELRLVSCEVRKVQFDLLRKSSLMSIVISGEQTMADIFSGCPNLEELSIWVALA